MLRSALLGSAAILILLGSFSLTQGQQPPRDQQIQELQKQIDALSKRLEELRRTTPAPTPTAPEVGLNSEWVKALSWRCIGPASMGGRIVAISVYEADPCTYFVATASGGLLKTDNNGVSFEHQFDHESTVSIGDVCVSPSDRNIVWVGTGEANPRNSVSYGDGVYKSIDGGKTWKNMGLKKSYQIGKIVIHPRDPNIVYVGALGRLYGPNEERGLFKTTDGGATWKKILYVDDKTGIIDLRMHPQDPETLIAAAYERQRDGFDDHVGIPPVPEGFDPYEPAKKWGPGNALWKTIDGGKSFHKLTQGLPTCGLGRIGIDYYRKDPKIVYAVVDSAKLGMGTPARQSDVYLGVMGKDADAGAHITDLTKGGPAEKAGLKPGDILLAIDNQPILSYQQLLDQIPKHKIGDKLTLRVSRNRVLQEIAVTLAKRPSEPSGAPTNRRPYAYLWTSQQANVQDKQGPDGFQYGGVYRSSDGGETWTRVNSLCPRPMYFSQIRVDPSDNKYVYVLGIELYRSSDGGKTFKPDGGNNLHPDQHALWIDPRDGRHMLAGCDGGFFATYDRMANWDFLSHLAIGQFYHVALDNRRPYNIYGGLQDNGSWGGPSRTLRRTGATNHDWIMVGGGDGFVCAVDSADPEVIYGEMQDGNMYRRNLRTGEMHSIRPRPLPKVPFAINWQAPFLIAFGTIPVVPFSPNLVPDLYRFNWNTPFLLSHHNGQILYCGGNYVFRSLKQGADLRPISPEITRTKRGSATALAESPRNSDVLYAGTDDGALWVTRDGGVNWTNITDHVGLPGPRWVASIEASRFIEGRAYVAFDAHRSDDDEPYVYATDDFGQTWKSLRANLPTGSTRVLREDVENPNLLFLGTEFGVYASVNRGQSWTRLNSNLPTVAVHELAIHPTAGEMVAATHGRSLWILDITPLRQMTSEVLKAKAYLYSPNTLVRWRSEPPRQTFYGNGVRHFIGENPSTGGPVFYSLTQKAEKISLRILDHTGKSIRDLEVKADPGLHKIAWDLTRTGSSFVGPGLYRVVLNVDGQEFSQNVRVEADPSVPNAIMGAELPGMNEREEQPGPRTDG
jgi:photosystem II stability/assembly factor-like uncharacterized protein